MSRKPPALPAPTSRAARAKIRHACETWKRGIYPDLPGGPLPLEDWLQENRRLVAWRNNHARHIDVSPLVRFQETCLHLLRPSPDGCYAVDAAGLRLLAGLADAAVNQVLDWVATGDGVRKGRPGARGYREVWDYVAKLRRKDPDMTPEELYGRCLKMFGENRLPDGLENFKAGLRRLRKT
jgi:hypothetical protein